jgi:hypothetical protein
METLYSYGFYTLCPFFRTPPSRCDFWGRGFLSDLLALLEVNEQSIGGYSALRRFTLGRKAIELDCGDSGSTANHRAGSLVIFSYRCSLIKTSEEGYD